LVPRAKLEPERPQLVEALPNEDAAVEPVAVNEPRRKLGIGDKALPEAIEDLEDSGLRMTSFSLEERYEGPIFHPSSLKDYKDLVPDAPERVFTHWETETAHRHKIADEQVKLANREIDLDMHECETSRQEMLLSAQHSKRGQWFAMSAFLVFLATVAGLSLAGHDDVAMKLAGWLISAVVLGFLGTNAKDVLQKILEPKATEETDKNRESEE